MTQNIVAANNQVIPTAIHLWSQEFRIRDTQTPEMPENFPDEKMFQQLFAIRGVFRMNRYRFPLPHERGREWRMLPFKLPDALQFLRPFLANQVQVRLAVFNRLQNGLERQAPIVSHFFRSERVLSDNLTVEHVGWKLLPLHE